MIKIDGSEGEGGGQVLRTALALSLATSQPFQIEKIRAARQRPGLMRQHLTAVQAATAVGGARVEGDAIGSQSLTFDPQAVRGGAYTFSVGTAGSATLVMQTVLTPLLLADGPSTLTLEGGTHNPWAPPFEFLDRVFLPPLRRMGPRVSLTLERHGFYPAGGGRFTVSITPVKALEPVDILERGEMVERRVRGLVANLPRHIADREVKTALHLLNWSSEAGTTEIIDGAAGPGNIVFVEMHGEHASEICTGFGESGVAAEAVANRAAHEARRYLAAGVPVGCHLADQLVPLFALAGGGAFRTVGLSRHARTNAEIVTRFLKAGITAHDEGRDVVRVEVRGHQKPAG
jgi:RNA 3'-terminal phosphate cyclase (ATP)